MDDLSRLQRADGRTRESKLFRSTLHALEAEIGTTLDEQPIAIQLLMKRAAGLVVTLEALEARQNDGEEINADKLQRAASALSRILSKLGCRTKPRRRMPGIAAPAPRPEREVRGESLADYCLRVHGTIDDQWREDYDRALAQLDADGPISELDADYRQKLQARRATLGDSYDDPARDLRPRPVRRRLIKHAKPDGRPVRRPWLTAEPRRRQHGA